MKKPLLVKRFEVVKNKVKFLKVIGVHPIIVKTA